MGRHHSPPAPLAVLSAGGAALAAVLGVALLAVGLDLVQRDPAVHVAAVTAQAPTGTVEETDPPAVEVTDPLAQRLPAPPKPEGATVPPMARALPTPPAKVVFPSAHTTARVVPVGVLATGALQLPDDASTVGWWSAGALPGEDRGTVVIAGHVDSGDEVGVLSLLPKLAAGDVVTLVGEGDQQHAYAVVSRESSPKAALDPSLFARGGSHRLALITCGGRFDARAGAYEDNVVVLAEPLATEPSRPDTDPEENSLRSR